MSRKADNLAEEIETLKRKIHLLDGDKTAYYENTQWEMEQNRHHIQQLRQENNIVRKSLSNKMAADDDVISEVFKKYSMKPPAELRGLTGRAAVQRFDQSVCEMIKRRNTLQHDARSKQATLEQHIRQLAHMEEEAAACSVTPTGVNEAVKNLRELENRLDRAVIQCNEAAHVRKIYQQILDKMQEEKLHYDNEIDDLERAIRIRLKDLSNVKSMKDEAEKARESAREQLSQHELKIAESKKEREKVLAHYRELAAEKKEFAEKVDRRRKISIIQGDDSLGQLSESEEDTSLQEQQEEKISSYEEAFAKIKDATGVSDIQEVVARFLSQRKTKKHLEQLREEHTQQLERLREERDKLQAQFEEMKYSGEAKMSSGQRMLEEFQSHLDEAHSKEAATKTTADRACRLLAQIKSGVDHLAEKLQNVKPPHTHMLKPKLDPSSDEYVLDQLSNCEHKLVGLVEELSSRELDTIHKEMEDEEFRHTVEGGIPGNVKIVLTKGSSQPGLYGDDESGSDDEGATRDSIKREAHQLVELKTKKKPQDDDDEDDGKKRKRGRR